MRILIIGSKGFIGHSLFDFMQKKGHEVWGADINTPTECQGRYFRIDPTSPDFSTAFQSMDYDVCVNCSGAASVPDSLIDPLNDYILNTVNVFRILDSIRRYQSDCRFINISSAAVYGNPKILPIRENVNPNPLSPYGFHKLQAESICREFWKLFCVRSCTLRIFSVYGPGLKKQLFWDLYSKTKSKSRISLYGTGEESRDFIYINDLLAAIELVAIHADFKSEIINIANGEEIFIKDAVSTFFSYFDSDISYSFSGNSRHGDPLNWKADIRKLKSLGYKPTVDIEGGLKKYFEWIRCI